MNDTTAPTATQGMLAKVRALLDSAESFTEQGNHEAAASYRAKAEQLMAKYRIDEEGLLAKDPTAVLPIQLDVELCGYYSEYRQQYINLFYYIAQHAGCRTTYTVRGVTVVAQAVGYETDLRYAELLYTNARLVFAAKLEPKVDPKLSDQLNAYRLRSAGMERIRVAQELWGNTDKVFLGRVGRLYKAECKARGEEPALDGRGVTGKAFREQYSQEFVWHLESLLRQARDSAGKFGGGLELHGRKERVDEAFYERYPHMRPKAELEAAGPCEDCARTKHDSGKCKAHRPRPITAKDIAAYNRYHSAAAQRGREHGRAAARSVDLGRTGTGQIDS